MSFARFCILLVALHGAAAAAFDFGDVAGKAESQAHAGQIDAAIETLKELAASNSEQLPLDAILMQLARAYVQKGNRDEARKTFTEIVDKHPASPYTPEARTELENLKG